MPSQSCQQLALSRACVGKEQAGLYFVLNSSSVRAPYYIISHLHLKNLTEATMFPLVNSTDPLLQSLELIPWIQKEKKITAL